MSEEKKKNTVAASPDEGSAAERDEITAAALAIIEKYREGFEELAK